MPVVCREPRKSMKKAEFAWKEAAVLTAKVPYSWN